MPGLMISRVALFFVTDNHAAPLRTHHHFVFGQLEVEHVDFFLVIPSCQQSRFVFVDKDYARRVLFALNKKVTDSGSPNADEHFYKIGTADAEERDTGFARDGPSQQRLASSRGPHEQTPFGNSAAKFREFF